ncbi:MAG: dUTP diphosphatase [Candidatus Schekmanbacteria bacterium]|nr:dUTP diphosphatase [Candidatus Schekmanbacteria bacterium]
MVQRLGDDVVLPSYETAGSSGMDLRCRDAVRLAPGVPTLVPTGLRLAIPEGYEAQVRPRSGLALRLGVGVVNSPGTVDSDYRGELAVILINHTRDGIVELSAGSRIAQLVVTPVARAVWRETADLPETHRGEGGFGSTGSR